MAQSARIGTRSTTASDALPNVSAQERSHSIKVRKQLARVGLSADSVERFLNETVEVDLHVKTVLSLSLATLGVLHAVSLCIHVIGRALAWARDGHPKHARG
ncbi:hypothetical protein WMF38_29055 [Sorangium sp. So ce118]